MKILIGSDLFYPVMYTGGEVYSFNVARCLVRLGHEVTVIAAKTAFNSEDVKTLKNQEVVEGVKIIRTRTPYTFGSTLSSIASVREMYALAREHIKQGSVDVVCPVKPRAYLPLFLAARRRVPCVALIHDFYPCKFVGLAGWILQQLTLRLPYDHVLTITDSIKQRLLKYFPANKVSVIYAGLNLETIDSMSAGARKRNQLIFVGNLLPHKNILDAIRAVELARQEINNLELVIASTGGPQEGLVKSACKEKPFIRYLGKVSDEEKVRFLKESSLLLLPSSAEGFGLVLIEALSCGTPFVAYDLPAVREVSNLTGAGVLVPHRDWQAMAQAIVQALKEPLRMKESADNGRKQVEAKFTWEQVALKATQILSDLLSRFACRDKGR